MTLVPSRTRRVVSVSPIPISADSRTLKQAASLARDGYESIVVAAGQVHVVTASGVSSSTHTLAATPNTARRFAWLRNHDLVGLIHFPLFLFWLLLYLWRNFFRIVLRIPKADLYILHEYGGFFAVWLRSRIHGVPFIYDAHDLYNDLVPVADRFKFDQRFLVPFGRIVERMCVASASEVFTVSAGLATALKRNYGVDPIVLYNAHDTRIDAINVVSARGMVGLRADAPLIVTVGNRKHGQALWLVGRTIEALPESFHWVFVGAGYSKELFEVTSQRVLSRIHLLGHQPPPSVVPLIRSATVAVMLYRPLTENFEFALPNGFFQCIAARLPQVLSPLTEVRQLAAVHHVGLESDLVDPTALANLIVRLAGAVQAGEWTGELEQTSGSLSWMVQERIFLARIAMLLSNDGSARHG